MVCSELAFSRAFSSAFCSFVNFAGAADGAFESTFFALDLAALLDASGISSDDSEADRVLPVLPGLSAIQASRSCLASRARFVLLRKPKVSAAD